ncbi:MAG: NUDIX hydrolase [Oscillospiraceae bacterium]|nr:NUDIX hydrolase [Oscillospiraceae bacterium]
MIVYRANKRFLVAVLGLITNGDGKILLVYHTYRKSPWGIHSGWIENEEPEEGLKREILEETNFIVEVDKLIKTEYAKNPRRINLYFRGHLKSGEFKACEEVSDYGFFNIDSLPENLSQDQKDLIIKELRF